MAWKTLEVLPKPVLRPSLYAAIDGNLAPGLNIADICLNIKVVWTGQCARPNLLGNSGSPSASFAADRLHYVKRRKTRSFGIKERKNVRAIYSVLNFITKYFKPSLDYTTV